MIKQSFTLANGWRVAVYYIVTSIYTEIVVDELDAIGCEKSVIEDVKIKLAEEKENTGFTYSSASERASVMVIGSSSTPGEFFNTLIHEIGHLTRHISKSDKIDPYSEDEQYLSGDIAMRMFPVARQLLCGCCRKDVSDEINGYKRFSDVFKFLS